MTEKFEHKKSLGQHFLNSDYAPKKMCSAADLQAGDLVLEIGPGTGILTKEILASGAKVVAIEADYRAVECLQETFTSEIASGQLIVKHHDARTLEPASFGLKAHKYKVVSNIPYYLSGHLFRALLDTDCQPTDLIFLVQKEVAERIVRDPKESLLSLSIKIFGNPTYICTVKRGHFTPPPRVDSAIVAIHNINQEVFNKFTSVYFFQILHLGFGQKRKQLLGNLSKKFTRTQLEHSFTTLDLRHDIRAEDVSLERWIKLVELLNSLPIPRDIHA